MYPEQLVAPMRAEMTSVGFTELKSADEVNNTIPNSEGTVLCFINSVCGCSAGTARPGVKLSLQNDKRPDKLVTVFAGNDQEAVAQVRQYLLPYPPSSPSIALFKDGKLVHMIERLHIEGRTADMIADSLTAAYNEYC